jgi:hypothetical protein
VVRQPIDLSCLWLTLEEACISHETGRHGPCRFPRWSTNPSEATLERGSRPFARKFIILTSVPSWVRTSMGETYIAGDWQALETVFQSTHLRGRSEAKDETCSTSRKIRSLQKAGRSTADVTGVLSFSRGEPFRMLTLSPTANRGHSSVPKVVRLKNLR